jgi:uncharacterized protein YeaO (DUF488 family)
MFTSNFTRSGNNPNAVAISGAVPKDYKGKRYKKLAPSWNLVNEYKTGIINEKQYKDRYYKEVLSKLNARDVYNEIGEDAILLCYEKPGEFCHRRIVAEWIFDNIQILVSEL